MDSGPSRLSFDQTSSSNSCPTGGSLRSLSRSASTPEIKRDAARRSTGVVEVSRLRCSLISCWIVSSAPSARCTYPKYTDHWSETSGEWAGVTKDFLESPDLCDLRSVYCKWVKEGHNVTKKGIHSRRQAPSHRFGHQASVMKRQLFATNRTSSPVARATGSVRPATRTATWSRSTTPTPAS